MPLVTKIVADTNAESYRATNFPSICSLSGFFSLEKQGTGMAPLGVKADEPMQIRKERHERIR